MRFVAVTVFWFCIANQVRSQTPAAQATFEVASVKASPTDAQGMFTRYLPDGGVRFTGASLKNLISIAYSARSFQIASTPAWIDSERFDIEARVTTADVDPKTVTNEQRRTGERLRSLLADRFQLTLHTETREQPVYALVVAKGGPKLEESKSENWIRRMGRGELKGSGVRLGLLVLNLSNELGRWVIDKTGLSGRYSFDLKWDPSMEPEGPSIFTALQEQLGLRLESDRGPVEFLVVDHAEKPSKN